MSDQDFPTDNKSALRAVCLFLAQSGKPHAELGFDSAVAAFREIGSKFGTLPNTIKNIRDVFDRFTDSTRVGWENEKLPQRFLPTFEKFNGMSRDRFRVLVQEILEKKWNPIVGEDINVQQSSTAEIQRFFKNVKENFELPTFQMLAESYVSTWGFINKNGERFKISNSDLITALEEILAAWDDWAAAKLNKNNENPDNTARIFSDKNFSKGAHKSAVNQQRRGFVHFINNVVHAATFGTPFDKQAANHAFQREDYEKALSLVSNIQANSELFSKGQTFQSQKSKVHASLDNPGENIIFYGAPGTGKSHHVDKLVAEAGKEPIRTVFHPDLQNSDFFGCLKPRMNGADIFYEFAAGPFMVALAKAYKSSDEPVFLVIEELNRAAASAVFGDLFLLLDRDETGSGEYTVSFPSPESRKWFEDETSANHTTIKIPSNLFIYATMNSADQGVFPIDTAFRRRWKQTYLPINYDIGPEGDVGFIGADGNHLTASWQNFVKKLNNYLLSIRELEIAEDRLLGQWFVKKNELDGETIPEKVLLYLWDDLLRLGGRNEVFNLDEVTTYGALYNAIATGQSFLSPKFLDELNSVAEAEAVEVVPNEAE